MKFGLILRAYAPFDRFGLLFEGDKRGPRASHDANSRVKAWVVFDPTAGKFERPHSKSDSSAFFFAPSLRVTGSPICKVDVVVIGPNRVHFHLHARGNNPLVPGSAPIDARVIVTASVGQGRLNINASLSGDAFPNYEVLLQDEAQQLRALMSYETSYGQESGPFLHLWGDRNQHMNAICMTYPLNEAGRFQ